MANRDDERRAEERFPAPAHVDCDFASPVLEDFGKVRIKNISRNGIGLISPEDIAPGMLMAVRLVNPFKSFSRTMIVRVVQVTPQVGGTFLIGGVVDPPLTYEELSSLIM